MLALSIFGLLIGLVFSLDPVPALQCHDSNNCTTAAYDSCKYECYDSPTGKALLCPIVNGIAFDLCGEECFTTYQYSCNTTTTTLTLLPTYPNQVSLSAVNPSAPFNGLPLNAAGGKMWLTPYPSSYCPTVVPAEDCPPGNTTVMIGGSLSVLVPGGQQMYLQTSGAWAYTQAHSASTYNVSVYGAGVPYVDGGYFGPNGTGWTACPFSSNQQGGNDNGVTAWQVFADLEGLEFGEECEGFYAVVEELPQGTFGAWQY